MKSRRLKEIKKIKIYLDITPLVKVTSASNQQNYICNRKRFENPPYKFVLEGF